MSQESIPVTVRLPPALAKAIDAWRRGQNDAPDQPEAVRRLAELGLETVANPKRTANSIPPSKLNSENDT